MLANKNYFVVHDSISYLIFLVPWYLNSDCEVIMYKYMKPWDEWHWKADVVQILKRKVRPPLFNTGICCPS